MALYRTGTAAMDAQGVITGTGTKWRDPLSLIRTGATIVFLTTPLKLAVISNIVSDTEMKAIQTDGEQVANGNYVILLNDSLTVDGMAQDVAETLRYYQSKETQIEEAIEFFKNFDLQKLIDLRDETVRNAAAAAQSEQNAQTWAGQSFNHAESAKGYMQQTQQIKDSALTEVNAARDQGVLAVNQTKDQAVAEMNQIKSDTSAIKDQAVEAKTGAESARDQAANHSANALQQANRAETEADRAHQAVVGYQGWKYERLINAPAGADAEKYYPVIFQEKNMGDMSRFGVFFQISTQNNAGEYPYNSTSFAGYARTSEWSDGVDSVYGNFTIYQSAERTIECIALPSEKTTSCFAVYVQGGAFPIYVHCESNVDVIVPDADYAPDGDAPNATIFKFGAADPTEESTKVRTMGLTRNGFYANSDYAVRNVDNFKDSLEIGPNQTPRFTSLDLIRLNSPTVSGILNLHARGVDPNTSLGYSRVYAEKTSGVWKTTFHTANNENGNNSYIQHDEFGNIYGVNNLYPVNVEATGFLRGGGGSTVGLKTKVGGKKDIILSNLEDDGELGYMVNQLQGWFYGSSYQLGGIRSGGASLDSVDLFLNGFSVGENARFSFKPSYGGHVVAPKGFNGQCTQGAFGLEWDHMGAPFTATSVQNNDAGWSPIVSGGSVSTSGYHMRVGLGVISKGNNAWPSTVLKLNGDGRYHRAFDFDHLGGIYTWGTDPWGGNYDFAKNPTSDRDLKHDIQYTDGKESYDRVMQWLPTMFKYNGSDIQRFGLIAQDLLKIDPQYVKLVPGSPVFEDVIGVDENGEEYIDRQIETDRKDDTLALDSNVMLTDMACAMVYMGNEMENMKKEIEELKETVKALLNK